MSDYLWDKTGARDAEVERLENLLGQLRHNPQPFTLPDELTATRAHNAAASSVEEAETTRAPFGTHALPARRHIRTSWLAVAAVLLLAFVALALALLRTGAAGGNQQSLSQVKVDNSSQGEQQPAGYQPQNVEQRAGTPSNQLAPPPTQENVAPSHDSLAVTSGTEKSDVRQIINTTTKGNRKERQFALPGRQLAIIPKREQPQPTRGAATNTGGSLTLASQSSNPDDLPLEKRLAAKEQLMYALRLTSSKLSEVRAKTLGLGDAKQGFVEGNRK